MWFYGNPRRKLETPDISLDDVPLEVVNKQKYLWV